MSHYFMSITVYITGYVVFIRNVFRTIHSQKIEYSTKVNACFLYNCSEYIF